MLRFASIANVQKNMMPNATRSIARSWPSDFRSRTVWLAMSQGNTRLGFAAWSGVIIRLATHPATATPTSTIVCDHQRFLHELTGDADDLDLPLTSASQLPTAAPTAVATTVVSPSTPLAAEILFGRSISGMLPSFDGPNSAACVPNRALRPRTSRTRARSPARRAP